VAGRGFYERPEIRDLLNALQALGDPTDDLALAGLLRSPALAFSDEALYELVQQRDQPPTPQRLWDALRASGVEHAVSLIAAPHGRAGRVSVAELLKSWLDATDYRAALIQAGQTRAARNVSKLLADAHASGIVSVGEFLEYVANLRDSGAREGKARATVGEAVQIMSVHAAKGLEFPVVVIGDLGYSRQSRNPPLLDADLGLLLPLQGQDGQLPAAYRLGKLTSDDQESAELDRLFYVAATRAREKLILSGCFKLNKKNEPAGLRGWLAQVAGPVGLNQAIDYHEEGAGVVHESLRVGQTPVSCTIYEPGWTGQRLAHTA
jgi:ATP-dependent helicase/nuclease subunit A